MLGAIENQVPLNSQTQTTVASTEDLEPDRESDQREIDIFGDPDDPLGDLLRDVKEKAKSKTLENNNNDCRIEDSTNTTLAVPNFEVNDDGEIEESLSGVSDTEIDSMILEPGEKEAKMRMW